MTHTSTFTDYTKQLKETAEKKIFPLKDHPQIPLIIDTLSRQERHHVILSGTQSEKINLALLESLAQHLANKNLPKTLRENCVIYFDLTRFATTTVTREQLAADFQLLQNELLATHQRIIFAINQSNFLFTNDAFGEVIKSVLTNPCWRIIVLSEPEKSSSFPLKHFFSTIQLAEISAAESLSLLKTFKPAIEEFHKIIISEEAFASAFTLASHYLAGHADFDKALELLDSAAARASATTQDESSRKPMVTSNLLTHLVSSWTQIPLTHLQHNKFQATQFSETLRKTIFGQDAAINFMGSVLQNACVKLQEKPGPLCNFLLVGPAGAGKTQTAYAIAEHLFGHKNALLRVNLNKTRYHSLSELKVITKANESRCLSLLTAIQHTPYAVVLLENIDQEPSENLDLWKDILMRGYVADEQGNKYDFRHAIIIMTTRLTTDAIQNLVNTQQSQKTTSAVDLMQLVLNNNVNATEQQAQHALMPQELCDELLPKLESYFSSALLQHIHVVPFVPLDYAALEKTIRQKIKLLARRLDINFGIELTFAPEVVKFIAHEALWRKPSTKSVDNLLEHHLHSCISHEILAYAENKNRPKRLLVQLNDNGDLLRCEFIAANEATLYNL